MTSKPKTDYIKLIPHHIYDDPIPTDGDVDCWVPPGALTCAHEHEPITFPTQEQYVEHARTYHPYKCLAPQCKDETRPYRTDDGKSTIVLHSHSMHRRGKMPHPKSWCYVDNCKVTFSRNSNRISHIWKFHRGVIAAAWRSIGDEKMAVIVENYPIDEKKRKFDTASAVSAEESVLSDDEETMHGTIGALNKKQKQNVLDPFLTNDNTVWANSVSTAAASSKTPTFAPPVKEQPRVVVFASSNAPTSAPLVAEQRVVAGGASTTNQSAEVHTCCCHRHPDLHPDSLFDDPEFQQEVQEVLRTKKKMDDLAMSMANRKIRIEEGEKRLADIKAEWARLCVEIMMPVLETE